MNVYEVHIIDYAGDKRSCGLFSSKKSAHKFILNSKRKAFELFLDIRQLYGKERGESFDNAELGQDYFYIQERTVNE